MNIEILYEDEGILAIDKPSGIKVHGDGINKEETLADWILEQYPQIKNVGEEGFAQNGTTILRPGIVHRLDKETSGVMLIVKNQDVYEALKKQFQDRSIQKEYLSLVYGVMKNDEGEINLPIGRSTQDPRKRAAKFGEKSRDAKTLYKVLQKFERYTYVAAYPKTGRTHQIRVHLNSIGHPVVCDKLYAAKKECPEGLARLALHAAKITFINPKDDKPQTITAPYPSTFRDFIATQRSIW
tara:strand:+ start:7039 stop:7758 length:720 start_codon:yes stop_codon:yes gene_type:complete